ncbi:DUF3012 domain-containing protein [Rheinheimera fenheensis]|jgi:hypothetical protein|uniref:DUF3012 domain-containing protein n=1 Tax=Rheinheimera fenheensis TaxID=3152295 RepID=UPI00325E9B18
MKAVSVIVVLSLALLAGCAPEVGSKKWCEQLAEKPKGDWTANEAKDYAKHCLLRSDD